MKLVKFKYCMLNCNYNRLEQGIGSSTEGLQEVAYFQIKKYSFY
ncbi:hypothetical protein Hdeb2414_s0004g00144951 [Helianthus debilis subsp. tardiflorus]